MPVLEVKAPLSLKNILFASDFSACSETALVFAKLLARRYRSTIFLGHVFPAGSPLAGAQDLPRPEVNLQLELAEKSMSAFVAAHDLEEVRYQAVLKTGEMWPAIAAMIEEHEIDLVVVATHGREGLRKFLLGSVAEEIFRRASCPVLTVGPEITGGPTLRAEFQQIVFATDFTPESLSALPHAISLAEGDGAHLTMVHVLHEIEGLDAVDFPEERINVARRRLAELVPRGAGLWHEPELCVGVGAPAKAILQVAAVRQADLIIMGVRHTNWPRSAAHVPWRTAHQVVCHAHCPVLTVRA